MRIGILITARMGSTRLPNKHLREMAGRPVLCWLLERIASEFQAEISASTTSLWIATGSKENNAGFLPLIAGRPAQVFFGSDDNVPLRHLQAAQSHQLDALVSVDGDDIFCAQEAMRAVHNALTGGANLAKTSGLPLGMNAWGDSTQALEQAVRHADTAVLETGWGRIFDGAAVQEVVLACANAGQVRATLDYPEDLEFFDRCASEISGWERLSTPHFVQSIISRGFHRLNASVTERYWENFNMGVRSEKSTAALPNRSYSERLHAVIPGGAHTYSRGDDQYPVNAPQILERAKGTTVWAPDGRSFLDYGMALRAVSIGYSEPFINDAAIRGLEAGNNLTRASTVELAAAERLVDMIDSVDMVKFTKNGSSATSAAVKLARAYTGRDLIARCAQHPFFSYDDWFIGNTAIPKGVPTRTIEQTKSFTYNDIGSLEGLITEYPDQFACVILEPVATDEPKIFDLPDGRKVNYLQQVEALCRKHGIVFILDEMITGFRWHMKGAQHVYGVTPDLCTFGKAMANGFAVAAVGGKRELMELGSINRLGQERLFLLSTTHGAEMCGLAAFMATMDFLEEHAVINHLWKYGADLTAAINSAAQEAGIAKHFFAAGPAVSPYFATVTAEGKPWLELRTLFAQEMIKQGVLIPWLALSYRHGEAELAKTRQALTQALGVCARGVAEGVDKYLIGPAIKPVFRRYN
jgi:glutamate-1-semialdehyde 2,1-aminomutase